ncbi:uncharacterized protein LOC142358382 [Convolutriloba macropyga]|uniref:uncharacterized protein LOC142358382 n=1 Tax=Convolutriloba macropyga TaxID=536237 RepID=UPI003F524290
MLTQLAFLVCCVAYFNANYVADRRYNPYIADKRYDPFMFYKRQRVAYKMDSEEGDECKEEKDCDKYKKLYCSWVVGQCVLEPTIPIPEGCDQNARCPSGQFCDYFTRKCS